MVRGEPDDSFAQVHFRFTGSLLAHSVSSAHSPNAVRSLGCSSDLDLILRVRAQGFRFDFPSSSVLISVLKDPQGMGFEAGIFGSEWPWMRLEGAWRP